MMIVPSLGLLSTQTAPGVLQYVPDGGCMYSDFLLKDPPPRYWHTVRRLWMIRWMVVVRIIQLGYNVLMLDTDVAFLNDFYAFVKVRTERC